MTGLQTPPVWTLHLAMVHGAMYDAVNSIDRRYEPYLVRVRARRWYSQDAAAATAAYRVLSSLVPAQQQTLDQHYQTDMARFWAEGPSIWTRITRDLSGARMLSTADNARLFAMLYLTGADSIISWWHGKARYLFWRPITAIREADRDGNPATEPDPNWLPLINNPPYPDHPSGLACVGSGMAFSLRDFFGRDDIAFSITSTNSKTTRSFSSFSEAVQEIVDARVYSGIHFRRADEEGARIGKRVARYRERHYFRPKHERGWRR